MLPLRTWLRTPRLTFALVACLAVSIGGAATVLTYAYGLLLRPLPYPEARRLVLLNPLAEGGITQAARPYLSYPDFADLRADLAAFDHLVGAVVSRLVILTSAGAERLRGETVTPGYFALLGARPLLGRTFTAAEYAGQGERTIVLSARLWRSRFAADPDLVGRTLSTRSGPAVVVGIMPDTFAGIAEAEGTDYWLAERQHNHPAMLSARDDATTLVFGRLRGGTTLDAAEAATRAALAALPPPAPGTPREVRLRLQPFGEQWREGLRGGLVALTVGSAFLLVIGCANVALLLLARLVGRERELAVRLALGAGRAAVFRMLAAETLVLAAAGGGAGLLLASWLGDLFARLAGTELPHQLPIGLGAGPLAACLALLAATALAFGLLPALAATRLDSATTLRSGGRTFAGGVLAGRTGRLLVAGQAALAVVLLAGAALFLRGYARLRHADFGFRTDNLLRYQVSLPPAPARPPAELAAWWTQLESDLRALPGVRTTALMAPTLPPYDANEAPLRLAGGDFGTTDGALTVNQHFVTSDAFAVLRVPLREGRLFDPDDRLGGRPVAVVSETLARRIAPGGSAVGRALRFADRDVEVVGIVADARWNGQRNRQPTGLNLFLPLAQFPQASAGVLFDAAVPAPTLIEPARRAILAREPAAALHWIDTMDEALDFQTARERFLTALAAAYGATAFLLAVFGLHGLLSHGVASRARELGIRSALGATAGGLARLVVGEGLRVVAAGAAAGLGLSLALGRVFESHLNGVDARDPVALGGSVALLLAVSLLACWPPARRASRSDPMIALRAE